MQELLRSDSNHAVRRWTTMEIMLFQFLTSLSFCQHMVMRLRLSQKAIEPCFSSQVFDFDQTGTVDLSDMLIMLSLFGDVIQIMILSGIRWMWLTVRLVITSQLAQDCKSQ